MLLQPETKSKQRLNKAKMLAPVIREEKRSEIQRGEQLIALCNPSKVCTTCFNGRTNLTWKKREKSTCYWMEVKESEPSFNLKPLAAPGTTEIQSFAVEKLS